MSTSGINSLNTEDEMRTSEGRIDIVNIKWFGKAVWFSELPKGEQFGALVEILTGQHDLSDDLLKEKHFHVVASDVGPKKVLFMILDKVPGGGGHESECKISDWIEGILGNAMSENMRVEFYRRMLFMGCEEETGRDIGYFIALAISEKE